jgi:hypothetical protein
MATDGHDNTCAEHCPSDCQGGDATIVKYIRFSQVYRMAD